VIRIWTGAAAQLGTCDHCTFSDTPTLAQSEGDAADAANGQVITVVTMHRENEIVFLARFCEKHFLQFSDLISDQVAALLYPAKQGR
jgi:hypothetical protein